MPDKIDLASPVGFKEFYRKLDSVYLRHVEEIIRVRFPQELRNSEEAMDGVMTAIDRILEIFTRYLKTDVFPGHGVYFDDHLDVDAVYSAYPRVIVDAVDGSKSLLRGETDVTSTLAMVDAEGEIPFALVSYPFEGERVFAHEEKVYQLPVNFDFKQDMERYLLRPGQSETGLEELRVLDRYEAPADDKTREKLDCLRNKFKSIVPKKGSVAKTIVSVATGPIDAAICKHHDKEIPVYDYCAPSIILMRAGGVFRDLNGNLPSGETISGFVAASSRQMYDVFVNALHG